MKNYQSVPVLRMQELPESDDRTYAEVRLHAADFNTGAISKVDTAECTGYGECVADCPQEAVSLQVIGEE